MGVAVRVGMVQRVPVPQHPPSRFLPLVRAFDVTPRSVHMIEYG